MKIGIYDPYLDDLGGGEKYIASIASCLSKDHDVSFFWDNTKDIELLTRQFAIDLNNVHIVKNIFSSKVDFFSRILLTRNFDVIIVLSDGSIPLSLSKKLILHIQQPLEQFNEHSIKGAIKLSRVSKIFCNSEFTKSFNEKRFNIKTSVIYPPVPLSPIAMHKENVILTVGRYRVRDVVTGTDDYKKFPVMIDAFKQMIDRGLKDWVFVIATSVKEKDNATFEKLRETTNGYPISFLINQTNTELWKTYSKAKIYWHAAGYGENLSKYPQRAEHFGISTVEAMGGGAVPVVINAGGQREIVTNAENGYLWDKIEDLIDKTNTLTHHEATLHRLSMHAKKRAQDFSPSVFCQKISALI